MDSTVNLHGGAAQGIKPYFFQSLVWLAWMQGGIRLRGGAAGAARRMKLGLGCAAYGV